jgi:hypothetical protein
VPGVRLFAGCGRVWVPTRIFAEAPSGKVVLGKSFLCVAYEFAAPRDYDLTELQALICESVSNDADDLWNQLASHEHVIAAISTARSFGALVSALVDHGGC